MSVETEGRTAMQTFGRMIPKLVVENSERDIKLIDDEMLEKTLGHIGVFSLEAKLEDIRHDLTRLVRLNVSIAQRNVDALTIECSNNPNGDFTKLDRAVLVHQQMQKWQTWLENTKSLSIGFSSEVPVINDTLESLDIQRITREA
jgi:hypothetical protein